MVNERALIRQLKNNDPTLRALSLSAYFHSASELSRLDFFNNASTTAARRELALAHAKTLLDEIIEALNEPRSRYWISELRLELVEQMRDGEVSKKFARALSLIESVEALHASSNNFSDAAPLAKALRSLRLLKTLELSHNSFRCPAIVSLSAALPKLTMLETLDLSGNGFRLTGMRALVKVVHRLPSLRSLKLAQLVDGTFESFSRATTTTSNQEGLETAAAYLSTRLHKFKQPLELDFSLNGRSSTVAFIHAFPSGDTARLKTLTLNESELTDGQVMSLSALLMNCTRIEVLRLDGNELTDHGAVTLSLNLPWLLSLRELSLRRNREITPRGVAALLAARTLALTVLTDHAAPPPRSVRRSMSFG